MNANRPGRLVILSGPSCVGKTPLDKALGKFHQELRKRFRRVVLYHSRAPRPGEVDGADFHYRTREHIEALRVENRYLVVEMRSDLQAVDVEELSNLLKQGDCLLDVNPFVARALLAQPVLSGVERLSVVLSPLSREEILYLKQPERHVSLPEFLTDVMRRKLLRRTRRQRPQPSLGDLEDIERRASSAYGELKEAWRFDFVIPNHDGEDSDNWDAAYYPLGDARKALIAFSALLEGEAPDRVEKWEEDLLP